jgi:hypothetical protein
VTYRIVTISRRAFGGRRRRRRGSSSSSSSTAVPNDITASFDGDPLLAVQFPEQHAAARSRTLRTLVEKRENHNQSRERRSMMERRRAMLIGIQKIFIAAQQNRTGRACEEKEVRDQ